MNKFIYSFITLLFLISCNFNKQTNSFNPDYVKFTLSNRENTFPESVRKTFDGDYYSPDEPLYYEIGFWTTQVIEADSIRLKIWRYNHGGNSEININTITINNVKGLRKIEGAMIANRSITNIEELKQDEKTITTNISSELTEDFEIELFFDTTLISKKEVVFFNYPLHKKASIISHSKLLALFRENIANFDEKYVDRHYFISGTIKNIYRKHDDSYYITLKNKSQGFDLSDFEYRIDKKIKVNKLRKGQSILLFGKCRKPFKSEISYGEIIFYNCDILDVDY